VPSFDLTRTVGGRGLLAEGLIRPWGAWLFSPVQLVDQFDGSVLIVQLVVASQRRISSRRDFCRYLLASPAVQPSACENFI